VDCCVQKIRENDLRDNNYDDEQIDELERKYEEEQLAPLLLDLYEALLNWCCFAAAYVTYMYVCPKNGHFLTARQIKSENGVELGTLLVKNEPSAALVFDAENNVWKSVLSAHMGNGTISWKNITHQTLLPDPPTPAQEITTGNQSPTSRKLTVAIHGVDRKNNTTGQYETYCRLSRFYAGLAHLFRRVFTKDDVLVGDVSFQPYFLGVKARFPVFELYKLWNTEVLMDVVLDMRESFGDVWQNPYINNVVNVPRGLDFTELRVGNCLCYGSLWQDQYYRYHVYVPPGKTYNSTHKDTDYNYDGDPHNLAGMITTETFDDTPVISIIDGYKPDF